MNIEQLKRNNLEDPKNLKYFADSIQNNSFLFGPAALSELLTNAFLSGDESFSAQAWFSTMSFISRFNYQTKFGTFQNATFAKNERVKSYTNLIIQVFKSFNEKETIMPFFVNYRKWAKKIMSELNDKKKTMIFAIDAYFSEKLKNLGYVSLKEILEEEHFKIKIMVASYYAFICGE